MKRFPYHFWVLMTGLVVFTGMRQSGINIRISFLHHTFGNVLAVLSFLFGGFFVARYGHIAELLIVSTLGTIVGNFVYGWINGHVAWIFVAQIFENGHFLWFGRPFRYWSARRFREQPLESRAPRRHAEMDGCIMNV